MPLDQFDIEASSLITMVAFTGGGPVTQKAIADELREFVRTHVSYLHRETAGATKENRK